MPEWEYLKIDLNQRGPREDELDLLNRAGVEGWSLSASARRTLRTSNVALRTDRRGRERSVDHQLRLQTDKRFAAEQPTPAHEAAIKFRDPATGDTWTGRGRMARWLKVKHDAGEDIEKYRV